MKTIQLFTLYTYLALFPLQNTIAQNYQLLLDKNFSSISAAESMTSIYHSIYLFEDSFFPKAIGKGIKLKWVQKNTNRFFCYLPN